MPRSCVAPGCKEGYGSKKSTLSFFSVPEDPVKRAKWQAAIPRENFVLKPKQAVCEKHFAPQDIIRKRLFKDGDGNVLGVSPYKVPRVAENAVPTLFPGCPSYISKQKSKPRQSSYQFMRVDLTGKGERKINGGNESTLPEEPMSESSRMDTFFLVYDDADIVALPTCWARNTPLFGPKVVIFSQFIADMGKDGTTIPILYKQVCFHEDSTVTCSVLGQALRKEQLKLIDINSDPLQSITDLSDVLEKMDRIKICKGNVNDQLKDLDTKV